MLKNFFLILLIISCANQKEKTSKNTIVDLAEISSDSKVSIDKEASVTYGPSRNSINTEEVAESKKNERVFYSLTLYPSLYKSFGYISLFKEIELNKKRPVVISSYGFSSIVAALYAKYLKPNLVEWKSFDLYQRIKKYPVYSSKWKGEVESFLEKEFRSDKLSQLKILLVIPSYNNGDIKLHPTKRVVSAIMESLSINSQESQSFLLAPDDNYEKNLKSFGAEKSVTVSNLPVEIKFKKPNDFLFSLYNKKSRSQRNMKISLLTSESNSIDKIANISDEINQVESSSKLLFEELFKQVKK